MYFSRGKNKYQNPYTFKDMYKQYIKDKEGPYKVEYSTFIEIIEDYFKSISEYILEGGELKLPYKLGYLKVAGKPTNFKSKKHMPINWVETNKLGKQVIETNDHSNYIRYKFVWTKVHKGFVPNISKYQLILSRANKRELAARIKSGEYEYIHLK